jgi:alkanesulfonate monooxygenase SsuD/methylene tetrahydromethanopterin reductase-like flavin-dependent oxidoreductase (luciferase family)
VGIGNAADEFAALGVPHNRRGAWSDDMLLAMQALWTGDGEVTHHGKHIQFERISAIPTLQKPHPRLWVGGNSESALHRAVRFGGGWHPINQSVAVLRDKWLPALRAMAEQDGKPVPALNARVRVQITNEPIVGSDRAPGTGTIEQIREDFRGLNALDAEYVVLDWYNWPDIEGTRAHEKAFAMLAVLADQVFDLGRQKLR